MDLARVLARARRGVADPEERFVRTGLAYVRFAEQRPAHLAVMHGPEIPKRASPELQRAANDTFQILKELAADAGITNKREARRVGVVVWSLLYGLATPTSRGQVPPSVDASAEELATLALRQLFRSFTPRASRGRRRPSRAPAP